MSLAKGVGVGGEYFGEEPQMGRARLLARHDELR